MTAFLSTCDTHLKCWCVSKFEDPSRGIIFFVLGEFALRLTTSFPNKNCARNDDKLIDLFSCDFDFFGAQIRPKVGLAPLIRLQSRTFSRSCGSTLRKGFKKVLVLPFSRAVCTDMYWLFILISGTQFRSDSVLNFVGKGWKRRFNLGPPRSHSVLHNRSDSLAYLRYADSTYATKWWHRWRRQLQHKEQLRLGKPRFRVVVRDSDVSAQEEGCRLLSLRRFWCLFHCNVIDLLSCLPGSLRKMIRFDVAYIFKTVSIRNIPCKLRNTHTHTHMKEKHGSCRGVYHLSL